MPDTTVAHFNFDMVGYAVRLAATLDISPATKHVLTVIAMASGRALHEGEMWLSRDRLCQETGLSPNAVKKCIETLVEVGVLEPRGTRRRANLYYVAVREMCVAEGILAFGEGDEEEGSVDDAAPSDRWSKGSVHDAKGSLRGAKGSVYGLLSDEDQMRDQMNSPGHLSQAGQIPLQEASVAAAPGSDDRIESPPPAQPDDDQPEPPTFDDFYSLYPRKEHRGAALRAWRGAVRKARPETILTGLQRRLPSWQGTERRFIPHPATWLNAEGWEDELPQASTAKSAWSTVPTVDQLGEIYGW